MQKGDRHDRAEVDSDNIAEHDRAADKNEIAVLLRYPDAQHDDRWNHRNGNCDTGDGFVTFRRTECIRSGQTGICQCASSMSMSG